MIHDTPLRGLHQEYAQAMVAGAAVVSGSQRPGAAVGQRIAAEVEYIPYGPPPLPDDLGQPSCELVATFGEVELEYAAIRRGAGLLDSPHRGTILVTGSAIERRDFLNRMVTQELKDLAPPQAHGPPHPAHREFTAESAEKRNTNSPSAYSAVKLTAPAKQAFWLNRKGRIDADLLLIELGDSLVIDVDVHQAAHTVRSLSEFIFAEDVQITDASAQHHHIAVHGRGAVQVIADAAGRSDLQLEDLQGGHIEIGGVDVVMIRRDQTGEPGFELIMAYDAAARVWQALLNSQGAADPDLPRSSGPALKTNQFMRPIGWYAFNIARIEAGTPLFNIDFGSTNLPHETGILRERVSFTKGCYLGQEIVARMESLGKPKQQLVGLRVRHQGIEASRQQGIGDDGRINLLDALMPRSLDASAPLPVAGAQVFATDADGSMGDQVGVVTSSTLSPMLSAAPIAFAMVKTASAAIGTKVLVNAEGQQTQAVVQPLRFLK